MEASKSWSIFHIDLKTAFLQGQSDGVNRDVLCQLPPAYGMNDATRRWWNILDQALCTYGKVPTRADRCCCVSYSIKSRERNWKQNNSTHCHDAAYEKMLDPIAGSPATGISVLPGRSLEHGTIDRLLP